MSMRELQLPIWPRWSCILFAIKKILSALQTELTGCTNDQYGVWCGDANNHPAAVAVCCHATIIHTHRTPERDEISNTETKKKQKTTIGHHVMSTVRVYASSPGPKE